MSTEQLTGLLSLPLSERVEIAQALWQSIEGAADQARGDEERDATLLALRRDEEIETGAVGARTHEQVMETVRRALE
jgi:putative addiction module component (TIGR02574 family)